jgi:hypothetical protein
MNIREEIAKMKVEQNLNPREVEINKMNEGQLLKLMAKSLDVLSNKAIKEETTQQLSEFTSYEVVKIAVTTAQSDPQNAITGKFTEPIKSGTISIESLSASTVVVYVGLNRPASLGGVNDIALTNVSPTFSWKNLAVERIYALTSAGTAILQSVGLR